LGHHLERKIVHTLNILKKVVTPSTSKPLQKLLLTMQKGSFSKEFKKTQKNIIKVGQYNRSKIVQIKII
jgi:hypothetical protein